MEQANSTLYLSQILIIALVKSFHDRTSSSHKISNPQESCLFILFTLKLIRFTKVMANQSKIAEMLLCILFSGPVNWDDYQNEKNMHILLVDH